MGVSDKVSFFSLYKNNLSALSNSTFKITIFMTEGISMLNSKNTHSHHIVKQVPDIISFGQ